MSDGALSPGALSAADIVALENVAARAWPAASIGRLGGWRLYASSGFSGRINACWPLEDPGLPVDEAIAAVEAWYAARGLPPLFKTVEAASLPSGLTARLAERGYRPRTETIMMTGAVRTLDAGMAPRILRDVDAAFAAVFSATASNPGDAQERLETLARIPAPRAFASLSVDGEAAAIGAYAVEGEHAGVFAMRTDPRFRRRGLARAILSGLLADAAASGARSAWLQVEANNAGAIALYAAAGFSDVYRYRYWTR